MMTGLVMAVCDCHLAAAAAGWAEGRGYRCDICVSRVLFVCGLLVYSVCIIGGPPLRVRCADSKWHRQADRTQHFAMGP